MTHGTKTSVDRMLLVQEDLEQLLDRVDLGNMRGWQTFMTGTTGFFGYWLLSAIACLNRRDWGIRVNVLSRSPAAFLSRHPEFKNCSWIEFTTGDVLTYMPPDGRRFDAFLHAAASVSPEAMRHPYKVAEDIMLGTSRVMQHCRASGAKRLVLVSSGAVYGELPSDASAYSEDMRCCGSPDNLSEIYASGKRGMEALGAGFGAEFGIPVIVARPFAFVGPWLPPHLAIAQLVANAIGDTSIVLQGDGSPVRSYLYAADLAIWLLALLANGRGGRAYNVGSDEATTLRNVAQRVQGALAPDKPLKILGLPSSGPRQCYVPDVGRARDELGVAVWTDLDQALRRTAAWMRAGSPDDPAVEMLRRSH